MTALRFLLSLGYAELAVAIALALLPAARNGTTGIVGFPLWANFSAAGLYRWYYAHAIALPVIAWLIFRVSPTVPTPAAIAPPRVRRVWWLVAPLVVFALYAHAPAGRTFIHLYHDGEALVTGRLLAEGRFPWRDFVFFHGLFQDPIAGWLGLRFFGDSLWGVDAAVSYLLGPLCFVTMFVACLDIVPRQAMLLAVFFFGMPIVYPALGGGHNLRFIFLPLFWIALRRLIARPSTRRAALFGAALGAQGLLAPESIFYAVAALATLACAARRAVPGVLAGLAIFAGCAGVFLAAHGALGPFLSFYARVSSGYTYATAIPFKWNLGAWYKIAVAAPLVAHGLFTLLFLSRLRAGALSPRDWQVLSINLFSILYFRKFIDRADEHILANYFLALPILFYLAGEWLDTTARRHRIGVAVCGALLLAVLPFWRPREGGPDVPDPYLAGVVRDFARFFEQFPDATVFDFTNEPALFYYFLGRRPTTRYPYVYTATTPEAQRELVRELEAAPPRFVIYSSPMGYDVLDGVPGSIRHYELHRYLITHYRPFREVAHHLVLERGPAPAEWKTPPCDWGFAPSHLVVRPEGAPADVAFHPAGPALTRLTPRDADVTRYRALELRVRATAPGRFRIGDGIRFALAETGTARTLTIPVGSCRQWYRDRSPTLDLVSESPHELLSARLIP